MILVSVKIVEYAAAFPKLLLITSEYIATVSVMVLLVYRITDELSSLISVIQLIIAPASTPGSIMGTITRMNVFSCDAPSDIDASSILGDI